MDTIPEIYYIGCMRPTGKPQVLEERRLRAIRLLEEGHSYRSVAEQLQSSLSSVVRWHQAHQKDGKKGLRSKPTPGRPPLLSEKQKKKVVDILLRGSLAYGYQTDLWTLRRVRDVIAKEFGVVYSVPHCWHLMVGFGWSCQKPVKRAKERDEEAIRKWKRWVWPQIKKN